MWLERRLHPWKPAWSDSPRDWKLPARLARNWWQHDFRTPSLPAGWSFTACRPEDIPQVLWPTAHYENEAVSVRSPQLIEHFEQCPVFSQTEFCALQKDGGKIAYFFLVRVGNQVRLADYGPAAQKAARRLFRDATSLFAVTSEPHAASGWKTSGLRWQHEEPIKVLNLNGAWNPTRYRLTMLDWDIVCL